METATHLSREGPDDMLGVDGFAPILLLVSAVIIVFTVLRRGYRRIGPGKRSLDGSAREVAAQMAAAHDRVTGLPLDRAPAEIVRWQLEMHEQAREWSARLDSKMSALAQLIQTADQQLARFEQLQQQLAPSRDAVSHACTEVAAPASTEVLAATVTVEVGEPRVSEPPQTVAAVSAEPSDEPAELPAEEATASVTTDEVVMRVSPEARLTDEARADDEGRGLRASGSGVQLPGAGSVMAAPANEPLPQQIKVFATPAVATPEDEVPSRLRTALPTASQAALREPPKRATRLEEKPQLRVFSATREPAAEGTPVADGQTSAEAKSGGKPAGGSGRPPGAARLSEQPDLPPRETQLSTFDFERPPENKKKLATEDQPAVKRPYEHIYRLADAGHDRAAIARSLGLPLGEVSLILSLRQQLDQTLSEK